MSTFRISGPGRDGTCQDCSQQAKVTRQENLCKQCSLYRTHPDLAPKYLTWTKASNGWNATCT